MISASKLVTQYYQKLIAANVATSSSAMVCPGAVSKEQQVAWHKLRAEKHRIETQVKLANDLSKVNLSLAHLKMKETETEIIYTVRVPK